MRALWSQANSPYWPREECHGIWLELFCKRRAVAETSQTLFFFFRDWNSSSFLCCAKQKERKDDYVWIPVCEKLNSPAKAKPAFVHAAACVEVSRREFASGRSLRRFRFFSPQTQALRHTVQLGPAPLICPIPSSANSWLERTCPLSLPWECRKINDQDPQTDLGGGRVVVSFSEPLGRVSHTDLSASLKQTREGRAIQFTIS